MKFVRLLEKQALADPEIGSRCCLLCCPFARAVFTSLASAASADSYIFRAPSLPAPSFVRGDKVLGAKSCFSGNLRSAPDSECFSTDVKFSSFGGSWVCSFFSKVVSKLSVLSTSS